MLKTAVGAEHHKSPQVMGGSTYYYAECIAFPAFAPRQTSTTRTFLVNFSLAKGLAMAQTWARLKAEDSFPGVSTSSTTASFFSFLEDLGVFSLLSLATTDKGMHCETTPSPTSAESDAERARHQANVPSHRLLAAPSA